MFKNYFKAIYRSILKNKVTSTINILGLTAGTVCSLYILLYVIEQYSYDRHHPDAERIYRVTTDIITPDKTERLATISPPIAPALKKDFPEIAEAVRIINPPDVDMHLFRFNNKSFYLSKGYYADSSLFKVFSYRFMEGSPEGALSSPYSLVISSSVAQKLFGKQSAIRKTVTITNSLGANDFTVTGVFDENAGKSHIMPGFFMSVNSGAMGEYIFKNTQWAAQNFIFTYIKLHASADKNTLESKLPAFIKKYAAKQLAELGFEKKLHLQPVRDIHVYSDLKNEINDKSDWKFLLMLLVIGAFIQLIACINFMNLSTSRSATRAKEIGIRKAVGATRRVLVRQFLFESLAMAALAVLLALPLLLLIMPFLNQISGYAVSANFMGNSQVWAVFALLTIITGLLAGSYPAFYLSSFNVTQVLKGNLSQKGGAPHLRKLLVVFQFAIAIMLILGLAIIHLQLKYMPARELGFDQKQKIIIPFRTAAAKQQLAAFKREMLKSSFFTSASGILYYPGKRVLQDFSVYKKGGDMNSAKQVLNNACDEDYFHTMGISLIAGRNFTPADTNNQVVINEAALKELNISKAEATGTSLFTNYGGKHYEYLVIGVMRDFNYYSLREEIKPLIFSYKHGNGLTNLVVGINTRQYAVAVSKAQKLWQQLVPFEPFEYSFLDENLRKQYEAEATLLRIINLFSILAVFISCLGLFGLAAFTTEQRTKEIGIRKVLGASVASITFMLSGEFVKLILIALLIASPLAWWGMAKWLQVFAYRISISWWVYPVTGVLVTAVALFIIGFQTIKAARANPANSLKTQ